MARVRHREWSGAGQLTPEARQRSWLGQQTLQQLATLASAPVPCAAEAERVLKRQLSKLEDDIVVRAIEHGATRAQALGLVRRVTGSDRAIRTSLLLSGEVDRARADIDALANTLFIDAQIAGHAAGSRRTRLDGANRPATPAIGVPLAHLVWQEAYECGEPTIDDQHRRLFSLGNTLIDTSLAQRPSTIRIASAVDSLLVHVSRHFADEEAWLASRRYGRLQAHVAAHARLLSRAVDLRGSIDLRSLKVDALVSFLANDVVEKHMLATDQDFYPLAA